MDTTTPSIHTTLSPNPQSFTTQLISHRRKQNWQLSDPQQVTTLLMGDSNLARISTSLSFPALIQAFHGATLADFLYLIRSSSTYHNITRMVVVLGINDVVNSTKPTAFRRLLQELARALPQKFPNSALYLSPIPFSSTSPTWMIRQANNLNDTIDSDLPPYITILTTPSPQQINLNPHDPFIPKVHWTRFSANTIMYHWHQQLNG